MNQLKNVLEKIVWSPILIGVIGSAFDLTGEILAFPFKVLGEGFRLIF